MMEPAMLIGMAAGAAASAVVVGGGVAWWATRSIGALRTRLSHSEDARTAAVERSRQVKQQVAQLQEELNVLRSEMAKLRSQPGAPQPTPEQRREQIARKLDEEPTLVLPRRELPAHGFADTMPLI